MDFDLRAKIILIISIAMGVIIVMGSLVPAIAGSTSDTLYQKNTGSYFALTDSEDTDTHVITVSSGAKGFNIKTDGRNVTVPSMGTYNPGGSAVADYIAIGVYEAYNDNGVLTSQAGVQPTAQQNIATFRTQALAGNTGVTNGTYQLWNFYQYTLVDKIMGYTVLGNMDSQYMMGPGKTAGSGPNETGLTSAAYATSATTADSVALFIENGYGSVWEFVGDTQIVNYDLQAGNALGGNPLGSVENKLSSTATIPASASNNAITSLYLASGIFGVPKTFEGSVSSGTPGVGINDAMWSNSGNRLLVVGGHWGSGSSDGLSAWSSDGAFGSSGANIGSRLAYTVTGAGDAPTANYGYVITFNSTGTEIQDVQALVNGSLTSVMPTGTTLNSFWDFDTTTGIGPFGSYYVAINLSDGANGDDETEARLSTVKGEVAYILNPANLKQTLAGNAFTQGEYNIMLMIPTAYWGFDELTGKLYVGSSANKFAGQTLVPYAHTYTVDPDVNTGNPGSTASASLAMGQNAILRLYATGDLRVITNNSTINLGQASGDTTLSVSITGDTLTYTTAGNVTGTVSGIKAYIAPTGDMVLTRNPYVTEDTEVIIGGYANNLKTTNDQFVDIGYCASGTVGELTITSLVNPYSKDGNTAGSTEITKNLSDVKSDLKKVDSILFTTAWTTAGSEDAGTSTATYNYFLAPVNVAYENPNDSLVDGPLGSLLAVIPLLVIVGIAFAAFAFIRMRNE